MNLLLTGASGFLGRYLTAELSRASYSQLVISRRFLPHSDNYSVLLHDFMGNDDLAGKILHPVDAVVHMAHAMGGSREEQMTYAVKSTRALLDYAISHRIKTFVLVSSLSVLDLSALPAYGMVDYQTPRLFKDEHLPPYVAAKLAQELLVEKAVCEAGINAVILRPGLIYDDNVMSTSFAGLIKDDFQIAISHEGQIPLVSAKRTAEQILNALTLLKTSTLLTQLVLDEYPWSMVRYRDALIDRGYINSNLISIPWWLMNLIGASAEIFANYSNYRHRLPDLFIQPSRSTRLKPLIYWPSK